MRAPAPEVLDRRATPFGTLELRRRTIPGGAGRVATEILIDGGMLMSSLCTISEAALATRALALHPGTRDLRVLVGGLGLGYTAHAALQDPRVGRVRVVERAPEVIDWMRDGLVPLSRALAGDARIEIVEGDVYAGLLAPPDGAWDLVLIDVDHSPQETIDPASAPFYRWQGQRQVIDHLAPDGILAVWSADDDDPFAEVLEEIYDEAFRERLRWTDKDIARGDEIVEVLFLARRGA